VQLGIVTRVASSTTGGANASGGAAIGYDFKFGAWEMGPFAGFEAQNVTVDSFSESGAGTANLRIGQQTRNSLVTTLGLRASGTYGIWMPYARVTFDKESNNDGRVVNASPVALASGNSYQVSAYQQDDTWGTAVLGVRAKVADNVTLGLAYYSVFSQSNIKQQSLFGSVAVGF
jgi:outer membrane lipase/esterase